MLKIVTTPNSVLTLPVKKVQKINGKINRLIAEMSKTLAAQKDPEGVGLAAPQVGVNLAIFITKPKPDSPIRAFINPQIIKTQIPKKKSGKKKKSSTSLEGCLSIPHIWSQVERPKQVVLEFQTQAAKKQKETFKGFEAVIIQHEVDHLNGILFTQRALEQNAPLYEEVGNKLKPVSF